MSAGTTVRERDKELSLVQHLGELRSRLVVSAIALVITTTIAFLFGTQLIRILLLPVDCTFIPTFQCNEPPTTLVLFSPNENFTTYLHVDLVDDDGHRQGDTGEERHAEIGREVLGRTERQGSAARRVAWSG